VGPMKTTENLSRICRSQDRPAVNWVRSQQCSIKCTNCNVSPYLTVVPGYYVQIFFPTTDQIKNTKDMKFASYSWQCLRWLKQYDIVTCKGLAWLIIMGSGFDDWIYWHFFTTTVDYNSSHVELLLHDVCLTNLSEESLTPFNARMNSLL
jgi:hypothetical protein